MSILQSVLAGSLVLFGSLGFAQSRSSLEGIVRDSEGYAVPNALIVAVSDPPATPQLFTNSARTDSYGRFHLEVESTSLLTLRVEADGLVPRTLIAVKPESHVHVTLQKGGSIGGIALDASSGAPIVGAHVELREGGNRWRLAELPELGSQNGQTGADGRYRIDGVGKGLHNLRVSARGYSSFSKDFVAAGDNVDVFLSRGSSIVGNVRDPKGDVVEGALVRAEVQATSMTPVPLRTVRTDVRGSFELAGVPIGTYNVFVSHPDFAPSVVEQLVVGDAEEHDLDVQLMRGVRVHGRVTDGERKPLQARVALLELSGVSTSPTMFQSVERYLDVGARADEDGRFVLARVPPGSHVLLVQSRGYSPERLAVDVGAREAEIDVGEVALAQGPAIRGRVKDVEGTAIEGANVYGIRAHPSLSSLLQETYVIHDSSQRDGSFALSVSGGADYYVWVRASGHAQADLTVPAGQEQIEVTLKPAGVLHGTVVDEKGSPVEQFRVTAQIHGRRFGNPLLSEWIVSAQGEFTLNDVTDGTHTLTVQAPGFAPGRISPVQVSQGSRVELGRIKLPKGGALEGFVVDMLDRPVSGASIHLVSQLSDVSGAGTTTATSDRDGRFELLGIPGGTSDVLVEHPDFAEQWVRGLKVDSGGARTEARVVLSPGGRLEGRIRGRDGAGVVGASIEVMSPNHAWLGPAKTAFSDKDGFYRLEKLPAGRAQVSLRRHTSSSVSLTGNTKEAYIREGETTELDIDLGEVLMRGQVRRAGVAATGLQINLLAPKGSNVRFGRLTMNVPEGSFGPQPMNAITDERGAYELLVISAGQYWVQFLSTDGRTTLPGRKINVPDVEAFTLDFDLAVEAIRGRVSDKETGTPIRGATVIAMSARGSEVLPVAALPATVSGTDGGFFLDADPGVHIIRASAEGYATVQSKVTVPSSAANDIQLKLRAGLSIVGRVLNSQGRGVGGLYVYGYGPGSESTSRTQPDGSFMLNGLRPQLHNLLVASETGEYAVAFRVRPTDDDGVELVLQRGGIAGLQVSLESGEPVSDAWARVVSVNGEPVVSGKVTLSTADGRLQFPAPMGSVELECGKENRRARVVLEVRQGERAEARVILR